MQVTGGGYIYATDEKTSKPLWSKFVYTIQYDSSMEMDIQDVFISQLFAENDKLIVVDENGTRYELDPYTGNALQ